MTDSTNQLMLLWTTLYKLKGISRTGWLDRGIPPAETESVSDHSFLLALIAGVVAGNDSGMNVARIMELAIIHDVAEAIVGDIPPYERDDIPTDAESRRAFFSVQRVRSLELAARKQAAEQLAQAQILTLLPASVAEHWRNLWDEYENQRTPEARFVKQVDLLEVFIQSRIYAERHPEVPLDGFADMARQTITHPLLVPIRDAFLAEMTSAVEFDSGSDDDAGIPRQT